MGGLSSCLGVSPRPLKQGTNPRLLTLNSVNSDHTNPFGPPPGSSTRGMMRGSGGIIQPPPQVSQRQAYLANGGVGGRASGGGKVGPPIPKLLRQSSSLSGQTNNGQQQQQQLPPYLSHQLPSQNVPKLVDIDDNPIAAAAAQQPNNNNSHLICNRQSSKQQQQLGTSSGQQQQLVVSDAANSANINSFMQAIKMAPHDVRVFLALFDYDVRTNEDLSFKKGEHLETCLSLMNNGWWLARSKTTKKIGFIPMNYVAELKSLDSLGAEPWYLGKIGRAEAETRLKMPENKDGAFIIRDSDSDNDNTLQHQYSLSLRHENDIKHYRIRQFEAGGFYINRKTVFSTIHDLVLHYSKDPDGLVINLREPCISRFDKPTTVGLSHDTCDKWEIDRNQLTLLQELGHGQFGKVFEGLWKGSVPVAIKTLRKGTMEPQDFLAEAQIMKKMVHDNLVRLFAVCTKEEPVFIITELMPKGALSSYLQTEEGRNLTIDNYIKMATHIANGMKFLEREKYVHRDLAARNILVGNENVCKIADFGLARFIKDDTIYEAKAGARFPIKWTAPEAAARSTFTIKSDVWSFGIVLYEIITKGGSPYPDMSNADALDRIEKGYRMPQPLNCPTKYYSIMLDCWNKDPNRRPTFETLYWTFDQYIIPDEQYKEASQYRDNNRSIDRL